MLLFKQWRIVVLASVVVGVSLAHYLTPVGGHDSHRFHPHHAFYRWFYHLPIILAAFWFGFRGGILAGLTVTAFYVPHLVFQWGGGSAEQWLETVLYNVVGVVTGLLSEGQKSERDRYRKVADELNSAYADLKEQTRILLETEAQLQHAERLSALGQLSAGLAHEIKTPLASIRGAAEIFADDRADKVERREFSMILQREVDRLNSVLTRFLEFARPKAGEYPVASLNEAVEEVLQLTKAEQDRHRVMPELRLAQELPLVRIESEQLRQVILNLVMNALQAMEGGGTLEVATQVEGSTAQLLLTDTGTGIPDELQGRLFDPFVTGRQMGTGLGLSIVKRILDNHGGDIRFRSNVGRGTTVEVWIPFSETTDGQT